MKQSNTGRIETVERRQINFMVVSGRVSDKFKRLSKNHNRVEYSLNYTQFADLVKRDKLRAATITAIYGPGFTNLYWSPTNKPFILGY